MIIRRISDGIKRQDWFTVMVEVVIVVVGVYVGIYIGDVAKERAEQTEINQILKVLQTQLQSDLDNVDRIHDHRVKRLERNAEIVEIIFSSSVSKPELTEIILGVRVYLTFFPNSSAFQSLRDQGYLAKLKTPDLQFKLANLYDSVYARHEVNAKLNDDSTFFYWLEIVNMYWDTKKHDFIGDTEVAKSRLHSGRLGLMRYSENYINLLKNSVRPELVKTIESLDAYLNAKSNP